MKRNVRLVIALVSAFLCWLFFTFTSELYLYSDNIDVAIILNGYYGNPLSQYQHPIFCYFIFLLAKIFPFADMYTVVVHFLVFFELAIFMYIMPEKAMKKSFKTWALEDFVVSAVSLMFCIFLSAGLNLWRANYTIIAGSFLFTGWYILADARKKGKRKYWITIGTIFAFFGYMLRKEAGLLFLPFIGLLLAIEIFSNGKTKAIVTYYFPACIAIVILMVTQFVVNSFEPFATAMRYNDARTAIVDYPISSWNEEEMPDIEAADYAAASTWFLSDTDIMTADRLEIMATAGKRNKYDLSGDRIKRVLNEMKTKVWGTDIYMSMMIVMCILSALWNVISQKSWWMKAIAISAILGSFIILFYFTIRGRAPFRIWQPVLFAILSVEASVIINGKMHFGSIVRSAVMLLLFVVLYYSVGQVGAHMKLRSPHTAFTSRVGTDDSAYEQTFRNDDLYIWPQWHTSITIHFGDMGKLPTQRVLDHNIAIGDWTSGQPYYTEFLKRIGHENPIKDLVEKPNVYIMSNENYILNFLRLHYGEDIELVESGTVNGKTAYQVERTGE